MESFERGEEEKGVCVEEGRDEKRKVLPVDTRCE